MNDKTTTQFTKLYIGSKISESYAKELDKFLESNPEYREILARLNNTDQLRRDMELYGSIRTPITPCVSVMKRLRVKVAIAAAISIVIIGLFMLKTLSERDASTRSSQWSAIVPGCSKAYLTISGDRTIDLTDKQAVETSLSDGKIENKTLSYKSDDAESEESEESEEHTLYVPRGGEYTLILSDGTKVMLNSDSKITYYTNFTANKRIVKLSGEAYFEVAHDEARPFVVNVDDMMIEVLGTSFNVNAYSPNNIQTVLVEGSIKLGSHTNNTVSTILKPNQLATFNTEIGNVVVEEVDLAPYISWTSNYFVFRNQSIVTIMETLSRWYDIDFTINSNLEDVRLTGDLKRYDNIESLLTLFEQISDVRFSINNRTILVDRR